MMTLLFLAQPSLALDTVASDDDSRTNDSVAHTNKNRTAAGQASKPSLNFPSSLFFTAFFVSFF